MMKKNNLIVSVIYLLLGFVFLALVLLTETALDGLFSGFTGAFIGLGIMTMSRYVYWNSSKNKERYKEKIENEKIEMHDELKEKLRGKSAQYTYVIGLFAISFSTVLFSVLDSLNIIENGSIFVFYLTGYLCFQIVVGWITFNHLMKKY